MNKRYIDPKILRALLARTGNQCAYPGCKHILFNEDNVLVAQLCHIEAVSPKGPRYNSHQSEEQRNDYGNLLFLCYRHHKETDNAEKYSVEKLREIKESHEIKFKESGFLISEKMIAQIEFEFQKYWIEVKKLNQADEAEMRMKINTDDDFSKIVDKIEENLAWLNRQMSFLNKDSETLNDEIVALLEKLQYDTTNIKTVPYYENPFINRNWELLNIGFPNNINKLTNLITQLEIKYYESYIKQNTNDVKALKRFEAVKETLKGFAKDLNYID